MVSKPATENALASSYMGKEELDKAQAKATRRFLKPMGYNPNLLTTYALREIGGIGMNRLYTDQGIKNVCKILKHIRARTYVGELFMILME